MKKHASKSLMLTLAAILVAMLFTLTACGQSDASQESAEQISAESQMSEMADEADEPKSLELSDDQGESDEAPSTNKVTSRSILDAARGVADAAKGVAGAAKDAATTVADKAKDTAEGVAEAAATAKEEAERKAAEREAERRKAEEARAKETLATLEATELTPKKKTLEYSAKKAKPLKLIECSNSQVEIASESKLDRSKLGTQKAIYKLSLDGQEIQRTLKFKVRDTKAPKIDFVNRSPKVEVGADYDPVKNINYVKDPVDGELSRVDVAPKAQGSKQGKEVFYSAGWYTVKGSVDTSVAGVYSIDVDAADIHGNTSHRTFDVTVVASEPEPTFAATMTRSMPQERTVYITETGKKYHSAGCRYLKSSSREVSLSEAINRGLQPCSVCGG